MVFKGCTEGVPRVLDFFRGFPRAFQGCLMGTSRMFEQCSKEFQGVIRGCCKHVSKPFKVFYRNLHGCFKSVFSEFQECYEECSRAVF